MADIELIIKIPEEMKEEIDNGIIHFDGRLRQAVINGTPYETVTKFADRCRECGREKVLDKIEAEIKDTLYIDSLIFGELIDFMNGKIDADDVIEEFNRVTRSEVLQIIDKYRAEKESKE